MAGARSAARGGTVLGAAAGRGGRAGHPPRHRPCDRRAGARPAGRRAGALGRADAGGDGGMTRLPRTLRLDPSDTMVFDRAAGPGEWAVPGGFAFWDEDPAALAGRRRQEFRAGFLGLGSFGWSTLVEVAEAAPGDRTAAVEALAARILAAHGAPGPDAARAAAEEEIAFAESLCGHPPG